MHTKIKCEKLFSMNSKYYKVSNGFKALEMTKKSILQDSDRDEEHKLWNYTIGTKFANR